MTQMIPINMADDDRLRGFLDLIVKVDCDALLSDIFVSDFKRYGI